MGRFRAAWGSSPLVGRISLAFLILGIGLAGWAVWNIWTAGSADPAVQIVVPPRTPAVSALPSDTPTPSPAPVVYPRDPARGDIIGILSIPALRQEFPIVEGTGTKELKRGVGHMTTTAMPGEPDNCVLSGHRDTVFTRLGKLKVGDKLIVTAWAGAMTYEISKIRIVHHDDRTVVVPADHAMLTVTTCYPFEYVGSAPDRYIIVADLLAP
jgi:sortase A